ncbi:uncharacterized protein LOC119580953 [Penaeus monodon]|uniref:uncharacterized protein LOC119580953 n=1 Tax=Penaeus monodon TaxID=6687 RepID=UPI0018A6EAE2|nr:uncharacterized protein LOC119580953 [Penaeus monodon]
MKTVSAWSPTCCPHPLPSPPTPSLRSRRLVRRTPPLQLLVVVTVTSQVPANQGSAPVLANPDLVQVLANQDLVRVLANQDLVQVRANQGSVPVLANPDLVQVLANQELVLALLRLQA